MKKINFDSFSLESQRAKDVGQHLLLVILNVLIFSLGPELGKYIPLYRRVRLRGPATTLASQGQFAVYFVRSQTNIDANGTSESLGFLTFLFRINQLAASFGPFGVTGVSGRKTTGFAQPPLNLELSIARV